MGDLLWRDLKRVFCLRNSIVIMLVLHIVLMRFFSDGGTVFEIVVLLAGLLVNTMVSYDQQENGMSALIDPGTDLRAYVREKFILLACMEVIGVIVGSVLWRISGIISSRVDGTDTVIVTALFCVPICISFTSVFMPIDLKYGPKKTRVFKTIGIGILISFFAGAFTNFWYWIDPYLGSRMVYYWDAIIPSWMEMLGFIVSAAAIVAVSYHISIKTVTEKGYCLDDKIKAGNVSKNIKLLRISEDMTQDQLAEKMFVTRQTVSNWENGVAQPGLDTLIRLSEVFETDVNSLINVSKKKKNRKVRKRSIITCLALADLIQILLKARNYCSSRPWVFLNGSLMLFTSAVERIVPFVFNTPILFLVGVLLMAALSLWFDIRINKRRKPVWIAIVCLLLPALVMTVSMMFLYVNKVVVDKIVRLSVRILITLILPFISGALFFLLLNSRNTEAQSD